MPSVPVPIPQAAKGGAAKNLFEMMESRLGMNMTNLGPFDLEGGLTEKEQDMHVCQDYGKAVAEMLGAA